MSPGGEQDYDEGRSQVRTEAGPQVMATLRNTAISLRSRLGLTNIKQTLRHLTLRPRHVYAILLG